LKKSSTFIPKVIRMLDFVYLLFIFLLIFYLMAAQRKEMPFLILTHVVIQYFFTTISWISGMDDQVAAILLLFLVASSTLLVWARSLNYSRETKLIKAFVNISQWGVLVIMIGFLLYKPYYILHYSSPNKSPHFGLVYSFIPPLFKICGNLLLFTTYLSFILNWGNKWNLKKSLKSFLPIFLFLLLLGILYLTSASMRNHPFT